jgi:hypothetical protein
VFDTVGDRFDVGTKHLDHGNLNVGTITCVLSGPLATNHAVGTFGPGLSRRGSVTLMVGLRALFRTARTNYAAERAVIEMNVAIFGRFGKRLLAPGWKRETAFAALGGADLDLSDAPPGEGARLTVIAIFGGINVQLESGTRVTLHGFSLLGSREALVKPGDGPELTITAVAIFGGVRIKEKMRTE